MIQQHLGFLFDEQNAKVIDIRIQHALEIHIEFGNVALWYVKGRGEVDVMVAPLHAPNASRELAKVLHYLAKEQAEPKRVSGSG